MAESLRYVGLDVGGTTMKAAVVDDAGDPLSDPVSLDTRPERGQDVGLETMCEAIRRAVAAAGLKMAGVDMSSPEPVQAAFATLAEMVTRLEDLVSKG